MYLFGVVPVSRVGLVSGNGFWGVSCSMALCSLAANTLAALASAASSLWPLCYFSAWRSCLFCIPSGLVLQMAKWMAESSCASCIMEILLLFGLLQLHGMQSILGQFRCTVILVRQRGGQVCMDRILVGKEPGSKANSGLALL